MFSLIVSNSFKSMFMQPTKLELAYGSKILVDFVSGISDLHCWEKMRMGNVKEHEMAAAVSADNNEVS